MADAIATEAAAAFAKIVPYYRDEAAHITLHHGACLDIVSTLPVIEPFSALISDPPWFGDAWIRALNSHVVPYDRDTDQEWMIRQMEWYRSWVPMVVQLARWSGAWVFLGAGPDHLPFLLRVASHYNWIPEHVWYERAQAIVYWGRALSAAAEAHIRDVYRQCGFQRRQSQDLLDAFLDVCEPGLVFDPFAGDGSTLVAAKRRGWPAWGIELDEACCAVAAQRLEGTRCER